MWEPHAPRHSKCKLESASAPARCHWVSNLRPTPSLPDTVGGRNRERPCRAASRAFRTPHATTKCRLRAPATSYTRPAPSRGKKGSSERAESRCLRTRVPMGGTRNRERPCRAASSVLHSPRHQMPPQGASHLLHAAGALSRQKSRASGQSRDVCAPACRWAAHAAERCPVAPPVAFRTPHAPNAASGRQPPLTRGRRPLAAKGSSERAESRCPCAPGCSPPICSILCQDGHVLTIKIYLKICGRPSKFADQILRWLGSKPVLWPIQTAPLAHPAKASTFFGSSWLCAWPSSPKPQLQTLPPAVMARL